MKEEELSTKIPELSTNKLLMVALIFGIMFLCIGSYKAGYNNGYKYVEEYKDEYIDMNCKCIEDYFIDPYIDYNSIKKEINNISV